MITNEKIRRYCMDAVAYAVDDDAEAVREVLEEATDHGCLSHVLDGIDEARRLVAEFMEKGTR